MKITQLELLDETTEELDLSGQTIKDENWALLLKGSGLRKLDLSDTNLTDEQTHIIGKLKQLQALDISGTKVTDLAFLEGFDQLEEFDIVDITVSAIPVQLPALKSLCANGAEFTDLSSLNNTPNLQVLGLEYNDFSDLRAISQLQSLVELDLYGCKFVIDISPLNLLLSLRKLCLQNIGTSNADHLAELDNLIELEELSVDQEMESAAKHMLDILREKRLSRSRSNFFLEEPRVDKSLTVHKVDSWLSSQECPEDRLVGIFRSSGLEITPGELIVVLQECKEELEKRHGVSASVLSKLSPNFR